MARKPTSGSSQPDQKGQQVDVNALAKEVVSFMRDRGITIDDDWELTDVEKEDENEILFVDLDMDVVLIELKTIINTLNDDTARGDLDDDEIREFKQKMKPLYEYAKELALEEPTFD